MGRFAQLEYKSLVFITYKISWFSRRKLLKFIRNDEKGIPINRENNIITKQNFYTEYDQEFVDLFKECFFDDFKRHSLKEFGFNLKLRRVWYQVYNDINTTHGFHTHPSKNISTPRTSNIIYLELNDHDMITEFIDTNGDIVKPNVKQGDVLSFNPMIKHRSPPSSKDKSRKTVISFNCDILVPTY